MSTAKTKRVSTTDQFELTYLRWGYLSRPDRTAVSDEEMKTLFKVHSITLGKYPADFFYKHFGLMKSVGMELDDVKSFAKVQLYSFAGLYSILTNTPAKERYLKKLEDDRFCPITQSLKPLPSPEDSERETIRRERSTFISFLKQRFQDYYRVCDQKLKGIRGSADYRAAFAVADWAVQADDYILKTTKPNKLEEMGYFKADGKTLSELLKAKSGLRFTSGLVDLDGKKYRIVFEDGPPIKLQDFADTMSPTGSLFHENSEETLGRFATEARMILLVKRFKESPVQEQIRMLSLFVRKFSRKGGYNEEVGIAKSMLSALSKGKKLKLGDESDEPVTPAGPSEESHTVAQSSR